jgi:hypothetical protein
MRELIVRLSSMNTRSDQAAGRETVFMVRVQRRFWSWGLGMRSENLETKGFMVSIH